MDGILNLNKPAGITSFQAVARVKRASGNEKTGHGGTLDPFATGVLPVLLGKANRLSEYLLKFPKTYRAIVLLGTETDTLDITGRVTNGCSYDYISQAEVEAVIPRFIGRISQKPPLYSALKVKGRRLYELAREGLCPEVEPRNVDIYSIRLIRFQPPELAIEIQCGRGTYIRSLARDLGKALGSCGCLGELTRTSYGPFELSRAVSLEDINGANGSFVLEKSISSMDVILQDVPSVTLDCRQAQMISHGSEIQLAGEESGSDVYRAYDTGGRLMALLAPSGDEGYYKPEKVFVTALSP